MHIFKKKKWWRHFRWCSYSLVYSQDVPFVHRVGFWFFFWMLLNADSHRYKAMWLTCATKLISLHFLYLYFMVSYRLSLLFSSWANCWFSPAMPGAFSSNSWLVIMVHADFFSLVCQLWLYTVVRVNRFGEGSTDASAVVVNYLIGCKSVLQLKNLVVFFSCPWLLDSVITLIKAFL